MRTKTFRNLFFCFLGLAFFPAYLAWAQCPNNPILTPTSWHGAGVTASYSNITNLYTVIGNGNNSFGQGVETGYADLTTFPGNGQIQAEVTNITGNIGFNLDAAGIFIRGNNGAGPDGGLIWIWGAGSNQYQVASRVKDGPLTQLQSGPCSLAYWLRIQNSGNVLYPAVSTDGSTWTLLPVLDMTSDAEFSAGSTLAYGLFVWSGSVSQPTTAVFGNVCVNNSFTPYPTLTPAVTPTWTTTPAPTGTFTVTFSPTPSTTGSPTATPSGTWNSTPTATRTPTLTSIPTATLSPTPTPLPPTGVKVWPNPFTPQLSTNNVTHFLLAPGHGAGRLMVANLRRRQIRSFDFGPGADIQWDGRDNGDNVVSSGVYLYLLESDGTVRRGTVTVMR